MYGVGPAPGQTPLQKPANAVAGATSGWDAVAPSRALDATWGLIKATNAYLETNEPWKSEPGAEVNVMGDALEALRIITILASPAVPQTELTGNALD